MSGGVEGPRPPPFVTLPGSGVRADYSELGTHTPPSGRKEKDFAHFKNKCQCLFNEFCANKNCCETKTACSSRGKVSNNKIEPNPELKGHEPSARGVPRPPRDDRTYFSHRERSPVPSLCGKNPRPIPVSAARGRQLPTFSPTHGPVVPAVSETYRMGKMQSPTVGDPHFTEGVHATIRVQAPGDGKNHLLRGTGPGGGCFAGRNSVPTGQKGYRIGTPGPSEQRVFILAISWSKRKGGGCVRYWT